jgi:hypothetical protein
MLTNPSLSVKQVNSLTSLTQHLRNNLRAIEPKPSELSQLITYTLIGTALVGILVYHYIKKQEGF